jgi:hypothetical protein
MLALREAGFTQHEIASLLRTPRATVGRRLAGVALVLVGVLAVAFLYWALRPAPSVERVVIHEVPAPETLTGGAPPPPVPPVLSIPPAPPPPRSEKPVTPPPLIQDVDLSLEAQARECTMRGDNRCVVRLLEGHAEGANTLAMLIEAYRALGDNQRALHHMRTYAAIYRGTPRATGYSQILARQDR